MSLPTRLLTGMLLALCTVTTAQSNFHVAVKTGTKLFGLQDENNNWVVSPVYSSMQAFSTGYYQEDEKYLLAEKDGKHYLFDATTGKKFMGPIDGRPVREYQGWRIEKDTLRGFATLSGRIVFPTEYHNIYVLSNGRVRLQKKGRYALADTNGRKYTPFAFDELSYYYKNVFTVTVRDQATREWHYGVIDTIGRVLVEPVYDHYLLLNTRCFAVSRGGDWRFIAPGGKQLSDLYDSIYTRYNDSVYYVVRNRKVGLADPLGRVQLPMAFDSIFPYGPGRTHITYLGGHCGLASPAGKELLKPTLDSIGSLESNYNSDKILRVLAVRNRKYGLLDCFGKMLIASNYSIAEWKSDDGVTGMFLGVENNRMRIFEINATSARPLAFGSVFPEKSNQVSCDGFTFVTDSSGKVLQKPLPYIIEEGDTTNTSVALRIVGRGGTEGMASMSKRILLPPIYKHVGNFGTFCQYYYDEHEDSFINEDIVYAETKGGHYGVYHSNGRRLADTLYVAVYKPGDDPYLMLETDSSNVVIIDTTGRMLLRADSSGSMAYHDDELLLLKRKTGYVWFSTAEGKIIGRTNCPEVYLVGEDHFVCKAPTDKLGLASRTGKLLTPVRYDRLESFSKETFYAERDGLRTLISKEGKELFPPVRKLAWSKKELSQLVPDRIDSGMVGDSIEPAMRRLAFNFIIDTMSLGYFTGSDHSDEEYTPEEPCGIIYAGMDNEFYGDGEGEGYYEEHFADVLSATNKTVSFGFHNNTFEYGTDNSDLSVANYFRSGDTLKMFQLEDCFTGTTYATVLNREIYDALLAAGSTLLPDTNTTDLTYENFSVNGQHLTLDVFTVDRENMDESESFSYEENVVHVRIPLKQLKAYINPKGPLAGLVK